MTFNSLPKKKIFFGIIILALASLSIWGIQWATYARPPLQEAINALESDDLVQVTQEPWLTFLPINESPSTGLIFYPGGRVDPRAYSSLVRAIAFEGYLVVIPKMPINMAVFDPDAADEIIAYYSDIDTWAIAGHSVGGVMAALYTGNNPDVIKGLALWAAYPANSTNISDQKIPVVSIYGSREVKVTNESVGERAHLLPPDTLYIVIEGGDHHQFGSYEINPKDHLATTSRGSQHQQIIEVTLAMLSKVNK